MWTPFLSLPSRQEGVKLFFQKVCCCRPSTDFPSKLRLNVVQCLHSLARTNTKEFHNKWECILPSNTQDALKLRPEYGPNLITCVLHDPEPKVVFISSKTFCSYFFLQVRAEALNALSCMLENSPLSRLAMSTKTKGAFTTSSERYAEILSGLHVGLTTCVEHDRDLSVRLIAVKTFQSLVANSNYDRIQQGLLAPIVRLSLNKIPSVCGDALFRK